MADDATGSFSKREYQYISDAKFTEKTLSWSEPKKREGFKQKEDKNKPEDDTDSKDTKNKKEKSADVKEEAAEKLGEHIIPTYKYKREDKSVYTGLPRFKTDKSTVLRVKLVQRKANKFKIALILRDDVPEEVAIAEKLQEYENVFCDYCVANKGKPLNYKIKTVKGKTIEFGENEFGVLNTPILRTEEHQNYKTFTVTIPIYRNGDKGESKFGTKFFSKKDKDTPIPITEENFINYIASGSGIKIAMTFKEHWLAGDGVGLSIVADNIMIVKKPPRKVIKFGDVKKLVESGAYRQEFYEKKHQIETAFSLGGDVYYEDPETHDLMPWIIQGPVMQIKWPVKSKFTDENGKTKFMINADISHNSDSCQHAAEFLEAVSLLDDTYVSDFFENYENYAKGLKERAGLIDRTYINGCQTRIAKSSKETDKNANKRYSINFTLGQRAGNFNVKVYDFVELLKAKAEAEPDDAEKINNLASKYYKKLLISDLTKSLEKNCGDPVRLKESNVDKVLSQGTYFIPVFSVSKYANYLPEKIRKEKPMGHSHGLFTKLEYIFLIQHGSVNIGGFGTGFDDDDLPSDKDDSDGEEHGGIQFSEDIKKKVPKKTYESDNSESDASGESDNEKSDIKSKQKTKESPAEIKKTNSKKNKVISSDNDNEDDEEQERKQKNKSKKSKVIVSDNEDAEQDEPEEIKPKKNKKKIQVSDDE